MIAYQDLYFIMLKRHVYLFMYSKVIHGNKVITSVSGFLKRGGNKWYELHIMSI